MREEYLTLSEHDLATMASMPRSDFGRVFLSLIQRIHDTEDDRMKRNPRIADEIKKDVRYQMGVVAGIKMVLEVPDGINQLLKKGE
jgi:hypothetical protein